MFYEDQDYLFFWILPRGFERSQIMGSCRFSFMAGLAQNQPSRPRSFHSIGGLGSCSISGLVL